jgi:mannosyltransferase
VLAAIVFVASAPRLFQLGRLSLWYDEVVSMRLARAGSPAALLKLLPEIDATRAPLHPLLLEGWIALFGPADVSGRAFSCLCGMLTVVLVYWVAGRAFDAATGLWAAWLCAVSPLLVYYSREVRMYALLVLITCLAWGSLFAHARTPRPRWLVLYGLCLAALVYTHPLGLLMMGALALASLLFRRAFSLPMRSWLITHLAAALAAVPWLARYYGREPESVTGPLPLRFLLGVPIGFIGGNFFVLGLAGLLIVHGLFRVERGVHSGWPIKWSDPAMSGSLLNWLLVPPVVLYAYSRLGYPIFGPARYTLFVGPAYLILVARGLAKLPLPLGLAAAAGGAVLSGAMLLDTVFRPDLKADWRAAAAYLDGRDPTAVVAVISADPARNVEYESARYYFRPGRVVIPCPDRLGELLRKTTDLWVSIGLRDGRTVGLLPGELRNAEPNREIVEFPGLRLMRVDRDHAASR